MAKKTKKSKKKAAPKKSSHVRRSSSKKSTPTTSLRYATRPVEKKVSSTPVPPLPEDQVQKFRDVLTQKRDDLFAIVQRKKEEEIEDVGVGDEADIATRSVEKEMLFELTDSEKQ